jgi:O-antigen/teichoic acid export membrane protein
VSQEAVANNPAGSANGGSLQKALVRGSAFEMAGYGLAQLIRLGSNMLLSRLLFPEAFGLSALVNILNYGLQMLSDVGLPSMIIQSEHGDDTRFLNTAFTWQALRAGVLWIIATACAFPMALIYDHAELTRLVPFGALAILVYGFRSTAYYTKRRQMDLKSLMLLEIAAQVASVIAMVVWAQFDRSVWALLGGSVVSAVVQVGGSHLLKVGYRNRFEWDKAHARSMMAFGKWVAGSSILTFVSQQGDRLLLGRFLGAASLGIYSIAVFLSSALGEATGRITHGVFFPAYSRVKLEGIERLREVFYRTRLLVDAGVLPALGVLYMLGPTVVHILYDARYEDAGWMLRVLVVRVALAALIEPYQFCLLAIGESRYAFYLNLSRTVALLLSVPLAFASFGVTGLVWGVALSEVPAFIVVYWGFARHGLSSPLHEARVPFLVAAGFALGWLLLAALRSFGIAP